MQTVPGDSAKRGFLYKDKHLEPVEIGRRLEVRAC